MKIHHLNCISTCPLGGRLMDGRTPGLWRGELACHCLLLEFPDRLVLVDTGLGMQDVRHPRQRLSTFFLALLSPDLREEMTAVAQVRRLGFRPEDVTDIVMTHLDFDHAGGLDDFPEALVHLLASERAAAESQRTWLDRQRFRPAQWSSRKRWIGYGEAGERWKGFDAVSALRGLPPDILLVPLTGHTLGHAGVAVHGADGWLLNAGDAYFHHGELGERPYCTPGLRFYQWMMEKDRRARLHNQARLRALAQTSGSGVALFCSHDPIEFERHAGHALRDPVAAGEACFHRDPD